MGNGGKIKIDCRIRGEGRGHHLINPSTHKAKAIFPAVSTLGKILLGREDGCAWTHLIRTSRTHQNSHIRVKVNRFLFHVLVCWIWFGLKANQILHTTHYVFRLNKIQTFERMGENQNNCTHCGQFATVLEKGWIEVCQGKIFDEVFL